jgi:regulatory protein YycI of two-component signal transduction system YycFG
LKQLAKEINVFAKFAVAGELKANLDQMKASYNKLLVTVNQDVLDRYVADGEVRYQIVDFNTDSWSFKLKQLYDSNGILLNFK